MFGRYRVGELLGRGGMGEVHRAHDTERDEQVALKRLSAADDEAKARFRRESRIAASLRHPHVVTVHDYGEIDGRLYLTMRLVEGTDLRRLLADGPLEPSRAVAILTGIASALDAAHAAGVVHRDVKPSNILLDESGTAFLADFGIAKSLSPEATSVTRTGEVGTLDYMAPERLLHHGADHRGDVYALACVLFECLTGKKPFPAEDAAGKLAAQLNDPPPAPSLFDWRIPGAVDLVVATGMDKDPARRYPSAGELMTAVADAVQADSGTAPLTTPDLAGDPGTRNLVEAIVAVANRRPADPPTVADECPYPGMRSFAATEAGVFHGREHAVTDVLVRLSRQAPGSGPLLVVGASGTGKSSLLRAGVLPALAAVEQPWPQVVTTPGHDPIGTLAARLAPFARADAAGLARWLHAEPAGFGRLCGQIAHRHGGGQSRLVLVVDQFEELFTAGAAPGVAQRFATLLAHAWPALVVLALRADFLDQCLRLDALRPALAGPYPLGPLGRTELERVIIEPAKAAGLRVEQGLTDRLIADVGGQDPGTLPRLAHALRLTWQNRSGAMLTLKGYQDTGGIARAVALTADGIYHRLGQHDRVLLRAALLRMVTVLEDGKVTRRKANRAEIPPHILAVLVDTRLATAEADGVQLSHDALLTAWPRLRDWIEQDRQGLILRQHLSQAAAAWRAGGGDGELYRGARLAATLQWAQGRTDLTEPERVFLRESARAQQRATRRLRTLVAGLAVFLVLALVAGVVAVVKWNDATEAAAVARSRQLAAESLTDAATDPVGARHKALEAWHTSHTAEARGALLSNATYPCPIELETGLPQVYSIDITPDGRYIAASALDGDVVVIDTHTGKQTRHDVTAEDGFAGLAFSPDGTMLAAAEADHTRITEVPGGREIGTFPGVGFVAWRADSRAVAAVAPANETQVAVGAWDPRTAKAIGWLTKPYKKGQAPLDGAYSPDGTRFAVGRHDGVVELWDARTGTVIHRDSTHLDVNRAQVYTGAPTTSAQVAFTNDSLVSASDLDRDIRFADPVTGKPTGQSIAARYIGGDLEVTPDGRNLLTIDYTAVGVALWSTGPRRGVVGDDLYVQGPTTEGGIPAFGIESLAVSAGGDVVGGQLDGGVVLWRNPGGWNFAPTTWTTRVAFAGDGHEVAGLTTDDRMYVWHPEAGRPRPPALAAKAFAVDYLPDGTRITVARDGTITLVARDGARRTTRIDGITISRGDLAVAPDGSSFAVTIDSTVPGTTGQVETLMVWDTRTLARRGVFPLDTSVAHAPMYTRDGTILMVNVDVDDAHRIMRWRMADLGPMPAVDSGRGTNMVVAPDGSLLVAAGAGVEVRDPRSGAVRRVIGRHPSDVRALAVSPDGTTLATGTVSDPLIRLWDLRTGALVATLTGHTNSLNDLAFSPDGSRLASASLDTDFGVWPTDPEEAARQVCHDLAAAGQHDLTGLGCPA